MAPAELTKKALLRLAVPTVVIGLVFFITAGTLDYWQAWVYLAIRLTQESFTALYFLKNDPEFSARRMRMEEKEPKQQLLIMLLGIVFRIGFVIPGIDHRFGWSAVPSELVIAMDAIVFLGYILCFLVYKENSYAGRTVEVEKGQKVVSTGPYSIVRHPMYLSVFFIYIATPLALGSYWALPIALLLIPLFIFRILNEEETLRRDLPGYTEYCKKTRYRLIPLVW
jgi:protein-S-isoprenylcysteine O-methyltransferase Ste14